MKPAVSLTLGSCVTQCCLQGPLGLLCWPDHDWKSTFFVNMRVKFFSVVCFLFTYTVYDNLHRGCIVSIVVCYRRVFIHHQSYCSQLELPGSMKSAFRPSCPLSVSGPHTSVVLVASSQLLLTVCALEAMFCHRCEGYEGVSVTLYGFLSRCVILR